MPGTCYEPSDRLFRAADVVDRIAYLGFAANRFGPIAARAIMQRGERWEPLATPFQILDRPHLRTLRPTSGELVT